MGNLCYKNTEKDDNAIYSKWQMDSLWTGRINDIITSDGILFSQPTPCKLLDHLWIGDYDSAKNEMKLRKFGITHIINVAGPAYATNHNSINYYEIHTDDEPEYPMLQKWYDIIKNKIDEAKKNNGVVLIHCSAGINRSAILAVAYIMSHMNRGLLETVKYCYNMRGVILTNHGFQQQLVDFASLNLLLY